LLEINKINKGESIEKESNGPKETLAKLSNS
jgi:hypothetical protein